MIFFQDEKEKLWLADKVENSVWFSLTQERRKHFAKLLLKAQVSHFVVYF